MASLSFSTSVSSTCPFRRLSTNPTFPCSYKFPAIIESKIREIFMPALSSTMTEGKIVSWIKSEGDVLTKGESVVVVESDKADMDVETFYDGILAVIVVNDGETAPVGSPIALLAETQDEVSLAKAQALTHSSGGSAPSVPKRMTQVSTHETRKIVATPNAKKLAKQYKVDIDKVNGTGPFGRITSEDVEKAAGIISPPAAAPPAGMPEKDAAPASLTLPEMLPSSGVVPFSTMQFDLSKKFEESLSVPTFRVAYPVVTDALNALYKKVKRQGVTMTALLAKAAAMALAQHPVVNAFCQDGKSFMYNSSINIAVFVEINGELIKLVLQDADKLDLYLLSQKWKELLDKARAKQLQPHEYNSGTFTLTNLGMFGVDRYDAILPPQGAIMAVGASKPTVVADADGLFSVKNKMLVNVTADHRIVYGADLAAFLQTFSKIVENPESMTM